MNEPIIDRSAKATFHIKPNTKWIVGRIVDIDMSKGGLRLAASEIKGVTVFLLVDEIGPDVKHAEVGQVIVYKTMNHILTRDGQHTAVVLDDNDNVGGTVEGLDMNRVTIAGQPALPRTESPEIPISNGSDSDPNTLQ